MRTLNDLAVVAQTVGAVAWRWLPFVACLAPLALVGLLVKDARRRRRARQLHRFTARATASLLTDSCGCRWGRYQPHAVDEHTACRDGLCGRCDGCKSADLLRRAEARADR